MNLFLRKLGRPPGPLARRYAVGEGERKKPFLEEMEAAAGGGGRGGREKRSRGGSGRGAWNIESRRGPCSTALRPEGGAARPARGRPGRAAEAGEGRGGGQAQEEEEDEDAEAIGNK